jgi:teichoic acid transport system permease protein
VTSTHATSERPAGLHKLGGRPSLRRYAVQLWDRRYFVTELARSRFRAANEADRLGIGWTVLGPLINAAVYGLIFGVLLPSGSRPHNFVPYLVTGVFIFQFFAACLAGGAKSIIGNMGLVRSLHFPRAVLPISLVVEQALALMPMLAVLAVIVLATGEALTVKWLLVLPALFLMTLFNLGVALIAARLTIHVRDLAQLIPFISRVIFYMSGIFFTAHGVQQMVSERDDILAQVLGRVMAYNPVHIYISLVREGLIEHDRTTGLPYATGQTWLLGVAWGVGLVIVGFLFFWRAEERYGRE